MLFSRPTPWTPTAVEETLESCIDRMGHSDTSLLRQQYCSLLKKSNIAYTRWRQIPSTLTVDVKKQYRRTSATLHRVHGCITQSLGAASEKDFILERAGFWPRASPRDILNMLTLSQISLLSKSWKAVLIEYAEGITMVQRATRISQLTRPEYQAEHLRELSNPGRVGWDGVSHPDWLLIELESNLLIRQVQAEIASEMLAPSSGKNAVVQLNMGEGKSSVRESLIPCIVANLADRSSSPLSLRRLQIVRESFAW